MTTFARLVLLTCAAASLYAQVTFDRILHADKEPQNWLTYSGTMMSQRYSALDQINPGNVNNLTLQWAFQARSLERFEATPLVVDGTMYFTQAPNDVVAVDAVTGEVKWIRTYRPAADTKVCCGKVNRGLAILGNTLYMGTVDAHLLAIDATTGVVLWNTVVAKTAEGYGITHAPLVVKDKVIVGTAGGEYGIRGFIAAYDANTGKEVWRFYTIPGPGEPGHETWPAGDSWMHGGASVWVTGSYDPATNLTYWGTGNAGDDYNGDRRAGDNLYTSSLVALDADTGKLKWHFQFTPHDVWDYDATQVPVLADVNWTGKDGKVQPRKVLLSANKNGFYYVLDRTSGEFLQGKPFTTVTWASGLDEKGRPMRINGAEPSTEGVKTVKGGTNWWSPSYSPRTGLLYIPVSEDIEMVYTKREDTLEEGKFFIGGGGRSSVSKAVNGRSTTDHGHAVVRAIDPHTGEKKWDFTMKAVTDSGLLTTASDLLFTGGREGFFQALDARTGKLLWRVNSGGEIGMGPMTYQVNGKQYVAFSAASSLFVYALK